MISRIRRRTLGILDERILRHFPGKFVQSVRLAGLRAAGANVGSRVVLAQGVRVLGAQNLILGDEVSVARGAVLDARGGLNLERGALIGFDSIILTSTHNSDALDTPVHNQGMFVSEVVVGAYTWVGARCVIQPGTKIGINSIIGSGAVVTKDLPGGAVYGGVPARLIRNR